MRLLIKYLCGGWKREEGEVGEVEEVEEVGEGGLMEDISTALLLSALHQCSANHCTVESILTAATASCFIATSPILPKLFTVHPSKDPS